MRSYICRVNDILLPGQSRLNDIPLLVLWTNTANCNLSTNLIRQLRDTRFVNSASTIFIMKKGRLVLSYNWGWFYWTVDLSICARVYTAYVSQRCEGNTWVSRFFLKASPVSSPCSSGEPSAFWAACAISSPCLSFGLSLAAGSVFGNAGEGQTPPAWGPFVFLLISPICMTLLCA